MWEVDPETKSKLLALQKRNGNDRCCDCGAPSPQWASPKFGNFICLVCAGLHRGLGVHISFVRSITMDAFKGSEMARMEMGGNEAWRGFWEEKERGRRWDDVPLEERYGGEVAEEWKERLACKVEGKEFTGLPRKNEPLKKKMGGGTGEGTPVRTASPAGSSGPGSRKEQNESYFARLGNENAHRSANLPPSQGGKYGGFGSDPSPALGAGKATDGGGIPGVDDFQKDPVAALTKGLGWFTTTVGKGAKTVNDGWIQPTAQKIASADLPTQARLTAASVAQNISTGTKTATEQLNRFIDEGSAAGGSRSGGSSRTVVEPERKDFWDSFGEERGGKGGAGNGNGSGNGNGNGNGRGKGSAIGTAAVRKGGGGGGGGKEEGWEDW